jgi:hypothetical protein
LLFVACFLSPFKTLPQSLKQSLGASSNCLFSLMWFYRQLLARRVLSGSSNKTSTGTNGRRKQTIAVMSGSDMTSDMIVFIKIECSQKRAWAPNQNTHLDIRKQQ